jgi:predicted ATPase
MITNLRIKNLKAWGEQLWEEGIEMAPITLFLGPNSAGKTSLLQAPLILKQTFESPDRNLDINLGGQPADLVDVGTSESVIHRPPTAAAPTDNRTLGLGVTIKPFAARPDKKPQRAYTHRAEYIQAKQSLKLSRFMISDQETECTAIRGPKGAFTLAATSTAEGRQGDTSTPPKPIVDERKSRDWRPERSLFLTNWVLIDFADDTRHDIWRTQLEISREFQKVHYLGPLRHAPERYYMWSGVEPADIGKAGERAIPALLASVNNDTPTRRKRKVKGEKSKSTDASLIANVSRWLNNFGIATSLRAVRQGSSRHYEVIISQGDREANLIDVGFGVSQVLPLLVLAYLAEPGSIIVAEQPELHLHPRAQTALADLIVEVSRERKIQFIIETHSEHMFRHLQTLIAQEQVSTDDCKMYFIDRDDSGSPELTRLNVNEYGKVSNWPKAFFGDTLGEAAKQTESMIARLSRTGGTTTNG